MTLTLDSFPDQVLDRREILARIVWGMEDAHDRGGACSVEDGYELLGPEEYDLAKALNLGQRAVAVLKEKHGAWRLDVVNSTAPARKGGYTGAWTW